MVSSKEALREKRLVALSSVGAAIGLTAFKIVIAVLTGSLGILAEAAHSALDLVAALEVALVARLALSRRLVVGVLVARAVRALSGPVSKAPNE